MRNKIRLKMQVATSVVLLNLFVGGFVLPGVSNAAPTATTVKKTTTTTVKKTTTTTVKKTTTTTVKKTTTTVKPCSNKSFLNSKDLVRTSVLKRTLSATVVNSAIVCVQGAGAPKVVSYNVTTTKNDAAPNYISVKVTKKEVVNGVCPAWLAIENCAQVISYGTYGTSTGLKLPWGTIGLTTTGTWNIIFYVSSSGKSDITLNMTPLG
jgi:hypothetical protein